MSGRLENDLDLFSINPHTWQNIPLPVIKAVDIIVKTCISQQAILTSINKDYIDSQIIKTVLQHTAQQEKSISQKFIMQHANLSNNFSQGQSQLHGKLQETFEIFSKDLQESKIFLHSLQKKQTTDMLNLREIIQTSRDSVKSELIAKVIKPEFETIRLEQSEVNRSISALEKQLKYITFKLEKSIEVLNSEIELNREKIWKLEGETSTQSKRFEGVVENKTEDLVKTVKVFEGRIDETFECFNMHKEIFFNDVYLREDKLRELFDAKAKFIEEQKANIKVLVEKIEKSHSELLESVGSLEKTFQFETEKVRIESEGFSLKCYREAKEKLIQTYREDLKLVKKKLEWLPEDLGKLENMNSIEARIYTLESRLKREETNRIVQKIEIMKGN